jgi:hypothetical protein
VAAQLAPPEAGGDGERLHDQHDRLPGQRLRGIG